MKNAILLFVIFLAGALAYISQRSALKSIQTENSSLASQLNSSLPPKAPSNISLTPDQKLELLRLRSQVAKLREQTKNNPASLEGILKEAAEEKSKAEFLQANKDAESLSKQTKNVFQTLLGVSVVITRTTGLPVTSFADIQAAASHPDLNSGLRNQITNIFTIAEGQRVTWDSFEFANVYDSEGNIVSLMRERSARRQPDGKFVKFYGLKSGKVIEAFTQSGDFQQWETTELPQLLSQRKTK